MLCGNLYKNKISWDKWWKTCSIILSFLLMILFIVIFIFIIISSIPGFEAFGFNGIFVTGTFNLSEMKAGIWSPIAITLLLTTGSLLIATPIGIKTATFIKFRLSKKYQKTASIIVQSLNGIPSVIFGLFAINSLGTLVKFIFGINNGAYSIINAMIMLSFMVLPTIVSLTLNAYDNVSSDLLTNPISLGLTKTYSIYKVYKKQSRNAIVVAVIIAIGRAFGETMAVSMILTSETYSILGNGFIATMTSNLGTLGSLIATNMFSETGGEQVRGVLYAFGIVLFIFVLLLNGIIVLITKKKSKFHNSKVIKIQNVIGNIIMWAPNNISNFFASLFINKKHNPNFNKKAPIENYIKERCENFKLRNTHCLWWIFWEWVCFIITFGFLCWICLDIIINGFGIIVKEPNYDPNYTGYNTTAFQYGLDSTGQALVNTIIIIFISLLISLPISLMIAIYLNEYAKNQRFKNSVLYFVDCLGSSPSIIFGMFGLAVFIELFGISMNGSVGRSLLAGSLTISIVILPSLIRTFQQSLAGVDMMVRYNAYSLGCTKWETIRKVVLKHAYKSMMSAIVLAIGRIISETAPLFLTAGLTSVSSIGLMLPGQTLTTRIYAQLVSDKTISAATSIQYECAFIALSIVVILIWIGNYIIPNSKTIRMRAIDCYLVIKNTFMNKNQNIIEKYHKQMIKNTLYLSKQQANENDLNKFSIKWVFYHKHFINIKIVKNENLEKLIDNVFVEKYVN